MVSTSALRILKGDLLHKLTARAIIRDWKDGALATSESEQEAKKRLVALRAFALLAACPAQNLTSIRDAPHPAKLVRTLSI